jgi:hypothetical protein
MNYNNNLLRRILLAVLLFISTSNTIVVEGRARAARVKIGTHYKPHDPVHIIVNKIGCVFVFYFGINACICICSAILSSACTTAYAIHACFLVPTPTVGMVENVSQHLCIFDWL